MLHIILVGLVRSFIFTIKVTAVLVFLASAWVFYAWNERYRTCMVLPNGLIIGYNAMFDFDGYLWTPKVILKYPDGAPLITSDIGTFKFSETTVTGVIYFEDPSEANTGFVYRQDVGFLMRRQNPELYKKISSEMGPELEEKTRGYVNTNLLGAFTKLEGNPEYSRKWCSLSLFPQ